MAPASGRSPAEADRRRVTVPRRDGIPASPAMLGKVGANGGGTPRPRLTPNRGRKPMSEANFKPTSGVPPWRDKITELFPLPPPPRINGVGSRPPGMPSPEDYWDAVDSWLVAIGGGTPASATWTELAPYYVDRMPVAMAASQVLMERCVQGMRS